MENALALNNVIITEVLYDPVSSETGGEAVQIYNPAANPIDISGWVLSTETSANDAIIPVNTILPPNSYYLIADLGWSSLKDNSSWPNANHEEAITLANADAGVAIMNGTAAIDAVGWGNPANITSSLFEGIPANSTAQGKALKRKFSTEYIDTNNNSGDFYSATPSFSSPLTAESGDSISVYAIVEGAYPVIEKIAIADEDSTAEGVQVYPAPKQYKKVLLAAQVSDTDVSDIDGAYAEFNSVIYALNKTIINSTTVSFSAYLEIPFFLNPRNYSVRVRALDFSNLESNSTADFEYLPLIGIEIDASSLTFNALPGKTVQIAGDTDLSSNNLTIRNIGNTLVDVKVSGTDLINGGSKINASSIKYTFSGNDYSSNLAGTLNYNPELKDINLISGESSLNSLGLKLGVPTTALPGNYSGSISIVAVAS